VGTQTAVGLPVTRQDQLARHARPHLPPILGSSARAPCAGWQAGRCPTPPWLPSFKQLAAAGRAVGGERQRRRRRRRRRRQQSFLQRAMQHGSSLCDLLPPACPGPLNQQAAQRALPTGTRNPNSPAAHLACNWACMMYAGVDGQLRLVNEARNQCRAKCGGACLAESPPLLFHCLVEQPR